MIRILYIGKEIDKPRSGADVINHRNIYLLKRISDGNIDFIEPLSTSFFDKFFLGISTKVLQSINKKLTENNYSHVFLSQSLYGRAAYFIKKHYPHIKIITFFHNIEIDYAKSYLKANGIKAMPFYLCVKSLEKKAVKYSDILISLNKRDSNRLHVVYKRNPALELPTSFEDNYDDDKRQVIELKKSITIDYLFVGVAFFANTQGIQWFIDNVMPFVKGRLYVVGKGMDKFNFRNLNDRIHIMGYVDDLSEYYYKAKVIISPIFTGAGMKTKTAEALMYGKTIIGTAEAFEGYEINERCMKLANNSKEFIEAITREMDNPNFLNPHSRELFCKNYNTLNMENKLRQIFS